MDLSLSGFGPEAGFEYEFPETKGNEARFNMVRCPYYETCKRYGCLEITQAFSYGDNEVLKDICLEIPENTMTLSCRSRTATPP